MKLKGLKTRLYNIFFHTHTVAGIVISFALFVIFYAGAFSLFRHDILRWENPDARIEVPETVDVDRALVAAMDHYENFAETEVFTIRMPTEESPFVKFYGATYAETEVDEEQAATTEEEAQDEKVTEIDTTVATAQRETERFAAHINVEDNYHLIDEKEAETTIGDTIYHLHYFRQIPAIGIYISGFVALFFLFASITGLMIHWRNIVSRFYAFVIERKWKQIWSNAHTVLGVIGFPFQVAYAITGAFFGLTILLLIPSALVLFEGDTQKIIAVVRPEAAIQVDKDAPKAEHASLQFYYDKVEKMYPNVAIGNVRAYNHGREDGYVSFYLDDGRTINGTGSIVYSLVSGEVLFHSPPSEGGYVTSVMNVISKLHFANFGGLALRVIYFILAMITCFMILSGVLLWQEARNTKKYTDKQKRFHHRVTKFYLAVCLGLFPAVAIIFIANKAVPMDLAGRVAYVNATFFISWLLLIIAGLFWNNFRKLNRNYLQIGGIFSLLIPITNGIVTGDWVWKTLANAQWYVASVDIFWMITGLSALLATRWIQTSQKQVKVKMQQPKRVKNPSISVESLVVNYDKGK
ncbi:MAG: PepSY-associated TM helix domain-containing protein [Bacteroidota bacterium]